MIYVIHIIVIMPQANNNNGVFVDYY